MVGSAGFYTKKCTPDELSRIQNILDIITVIQRSGIYKVQESGINYSSGKARIPRGTRFDIFKLEDAFHYYISKALISFGAPDYKNVYEAAIFNSPNEDKIFMPDEKYFSKKLSDEVVQTLTTNFLVDVHKEVALL